MDRKKLSGLDQSSRVGLGCHAIVNRLVTIYGSTQRLLIFLWK